MRQPLEITPESPAHFSTGTDNFPAPDFWARDSARPYSSSWDTKTSDILVERPELWDQGSLVGKICLSGKVARATDNKVQASGIPK